MSQLPTQMTEAVTELVAIGAAIASNCEACFRHYFEAGRGLGLSRDDMRKAVEVGVRVKAAPHRKVMEAVDSCLSLEEPGAGAPGDGCGCRSGACC